VSLTLPTAPNFCPQHARTGDGELALKQPRESRVM